MASVIFARSAIRPAYSKQLRRFATERTPQPPPSPSPSPSKPAGGNNNAYLLAIGGAGVLGAGYYFLRGAPAAKKAEAAVKDAAGTLGLAKATLTGGDQSFVSLKLEDVKIINHNTKKLRFALPEADQVSGVTVASAILTKFQPNNEAKPVVRPYTPISDEDEKGHMDLLVKKYENGPMSTHLHDLTPGQRLDFKGPIPKYAWSPNKHDHIGLVAGGTGIAPMYQLIRAIFKNPEDKTKVTLVFGNVSEKDILLKKELTELENTHPQRFRAFYVVDKPASKEWAGGKGFIAKELLKKVLPEPKEENAKVFVCGPPGLMSAISGNKTSPKDQGELTGALKELGYRPDQVYKF